MQPRSAILRSGAKGAAPFVKQGQHDPVVIEQLALLLYRKRDDIV
jgi:hypothetical protein